MYWNIEGMTRLSFARSGEVLTSFELGYQDPSVDPEVVNALDGLDFDDYRDRESKGLVAVERFTGRGVRPEDLARIEAVDVANPILPHLPELYAEERLPDGSRRRSGGGPLAADTDALSFLPAEQLRDLAWWAAGEVASHAGLAHQHAVQATLAARCLSPDAEIMARTSQLHSRGQHHLMWMTLHYATNPDPLAAATGALATARYAVGGAATDLLDRARQHITTS